MKQPKVGKGGHLTGISKDRYGFQNHVSDIIEIFEKRLRNHTLNEVCQYIAGYFYRQQSKNLKEIERLRWGKPWNPIDTAPIHEVLLLAEPHSKSTKTKTYLWYRIGIGGFEDGAWRIHAPDFEIKINPSHWMPLPKPPEGTLWFM